MKIIVYFFWGGYRSYVIRNGVFFCDYNYKSMV